MKIATEHFMHAEYFISWTLFECSSNIISLKHLLRCQFFNENLLDFRRNFTCCIFSSSSFDLGTQRNNATDWT